MNQIALPLETASSDEDSGYIITNSNQHAHEQLQNWQNWANRTMILIGPEKSGKTSMARQFTKENEGYIIDEADQADDDAIFHLWNRAQEERKPLLLLSAKPAADWGVKLPDLQSRLAASLLVQIGEPDDAMVEGLLQKYFTRRGLSISEDALAYLVKRMERSYQNVQLLAAKMDALAIERKKPVTLTIAREILSEHTKKEDQGED